jgi:Ca2+:H+ antiporter
MTKSEKLIIIGGLIFTVLSGFAIHSGFNSVLAFIITAIALVLLAMNVGHATDQLGKRMGPGATGVLQSAFGNLPELFVCIFALKAGLDKVVQSALVGSILANSLLVFGLALLFGGLKNGTQKFKSEPPKMMVTLMLLAFAALAIPTFVHELHTPADSHISTLNIMVAIVLLIVFVASLKFSISGDKTVTPDEATTENKHVGWNSMTTYIVLICTGICAALVADWFVEALQPAMKILGINDVFAGLVVVAIAGNAIENLVGIQLAFKNKADYAVSVIMNSSLQIALGLFPMLVLISYFLGGALLSFVLSPLLLACLALAIIVSAFIVFDGESIWLEGVALVGLYFLIALAFWWG